MNALGSSVMADDDVPHGTREGWQAGCRGSSCPSAPMGLSCTTAHRRFAGDYQFRKLVEAGRTPAEIVALEGGAVETPARAKPKPRPVEVPVVRVQCSGEVSASTRNSTLMYRCELDEGHGEDFHLSHYRNGKPLRWAVAAADEETDVATVSVEIDTSKWDAAVEAIENRVDVAALSEFARSVTGALRSTAESVGLIPPVAKSDVALVPVPEPVAVLVVDEAVAAAVRSDSPIRPVLSVRPFEGGSGAYSVAEVSQREAAAELAKLGARRLAAWAEIEAVREPSNVLVVRLVELGMVQHEVAELAGISQASVAALVKQQKRGGRK